MFIRHRLFLFTHIHVSSAPAMQQVFLLGILTRPTFALCGISTSITEDRTSQISTSTITERKTFHVRAGPLTRNTCVQFTSFQSNNTTSCNFYVIHYKNFKKLIRINRII